MESVWIEAGAPLMICGVDYEVPPEVIERRRALMAGRRIIEEVDAEGVSHFLPMRAPNRPARRRPLREWLGRPRGRRFPG
jgi:hypothetical protein